MALPKTWSPGRKRNLASIGWRIRRIITRRASGAQPQTGAASSGKRAPTRPLHPDLVVLVFGLVAPFFLYGVITSQPEALPIVLLVLAGFCGFYIWKRKAMIAKFQAQQLAQQATEERIKRGVGRWMRLYYCAREDVVFEPRGSAAVPADQMAGYLLMNPPHPGPLPQGEGGSGPGSRASAGCRIHQRARAEPPSPQGRGSG